MQSDGGSHHPCAPAHREPRSLQPRHENRRAPRATEGVGAGSRGYGPGSHCPNLQKLRGGSSYYGLHQPIHPAILTYIGDECPTVIGGKSHRVISQTSSVETRPFASRFPSPYVPARRVPRQAGTATIAASTASSPVVHPLGEKGGVLLHSP